MIAKLAALSAAMAIAAGAFGAHRATGDAAEWLKTGGTYQLIHAVAILAVLEAKDAARGPAILMMFGSVLFAVTLYLMAMGAPRWLGAITPIGGVAMIAAWVWLALK